MLDLSFLLEKQPQLISEIDAVHSAVIIPLIKVEDGYEVLFEKRAEDLNGSREISVFREVRLKMVKQWRMPC